MFSFKPIYFVLVLIILGGCSGTSSVGKADEEADVINLQQVVATNQDVLDERAIIQDVFHSIKSFKKFSFITPEDYLEKASFVYYPENDHLDYYESYSIEGVYNTIDLRSKKNFSPKKDYQFKRDSLNNIRSIDHESLQIEIGKFKEEDFSIMLAKEGEKTLYESSYYHKDFTDNLMNQVAHSLKSEDQGVYDLYFDRILLDMDKIKLPNLNPNKIGVQSISSSFTEVNGFSLELIYSTPDKYEFIYIIRDTEQIESQYQKKGTEILNGTEISLYFNEYNQGFNVFMWSDDEHFYELRNSIKTSLTDKEDIYEIIKSSMDDSRSFTDMSLFKPTNPKPVLNSEDKEIRDKIKMFSK